MTVTFFFGIQFKDVYLPWVLPCLDSLTSGQFVMELLGIVVGHIYFFLKFKYPVNFGALRLLANPAIFSELIPEQSGGVTQEILDP